MPPPPPMRADAVEAEPAAITAAAASAMITLRIMMFTPLVAVTHPGQFALPHPSRHQAAVFATQDFDRKVHLKNRNEVRN
jgi:hypothetical protein